MNAICTRRSPFPWLAFHIVSIAVFTTGLTADSGDGWAKHHKKAQRSAPNTTDPCASVKAYIQKHIVELKKLTAEIQAEASAPPKSLQAAIERLEGKPFVDTAKNKKIAETRHEAASLNSLLKSEGCKPIDINGELAKP